MRNLVAVNVEVGRTCVVSIGAVLNYTAAALSAKIGQSLAMSIDWEQIRGQKV
jgi:hypothetical protein